MPNAPILLVGDGVVSWLSCGEVLRRAGYGVLEAASSDAALRLMRRGTPAALLLRIAGDGAAARLCRRVRSHPPFMGLPILGVVVGRPRVRLTAGGFSDLVRDPFSPEQLLRMMARWLPLPEVGAGDRRDNPVAVAPASEWRGVS